MTKMPNWYNTEKSTKKIANEKEDKVYKHLCSGALSFKGDFSDTDSLIDNKSTKFKSIKVTEDMCKKLLEDCLTMGKKCGILILDLPNYYLECKVTRKKNL